jgi:hypothetical protein
MTEAEWLTCDDPQKMLEFLRDGGKASDRKLRLFGCVCCRAIWELLTDERSREGVMVAERYADGQASTDQLAEAHLIAYAAHDNEDFADYWAAAWIAPAVSLRASLGTAEEALKAATPNAAASARKIQVDMLRDIVDNPFRPAALDPAWLAWNNGTVPKIAQAAYDERLLPSGHLDAGRLAILADALEEAGCSVTEILDHLRGLDPHIRGCWVVDLLLGKS